MYFDVPRTVVISHDARKITIPILITIMIFISIMILIPILL